MVGCGVELRLQSATTEAVHSAVDCSTNYQRKQQHIIYRHCSGMGCCNKRDCEHWRGYCNADQR